MSNLENYLLDVASHTRGSHILIPWGCDFGYMNATEDFENTDRLIDYFHKNTKTNIKLKYSTPGQFLKEANE